MIYLKENPIGIDYVLQKAQQKIYTHLTEKLGYELDGYGRCYVEKDKVDGKDVFVPKHYLDRNIGTDSYEAPMVLYSEGNKFFFLVNDSMPSDGISFYKTGVSIYFCFDLNTVKPEIKHRPDNEIRVDCQEIVQKCGLGLIDIETGFSNVFRAFKIAGTDYDTEDTGRYHWFKFDIPNVNFRINKKC